jgi:hypothetical protein
VPIALTDRTVSTDEQFLAKDRDIRELMGARQLYIADVLDVQHDARPPLTPSAPRVEFRGRGIGSLESDDPGFKVAVAAVFAIHIQGVCTRPRNQ